ncbi:MAG: hypothetical protein K2X67_04080 [Burkholderiales bacterium]|nr:hypothetical protein [Burkholderiales bacterium]
MKALTAYEEKLLDYLRKEAEELKDCFTQFSFQAIAVSSVGLGLLARFQPNFPLLGLGGICVVLIALSVGRIGTYKYAGANRINGYELYLDRIRRLEDTPGWKETYREVGWEEAVRAWRTVQPTVFRLYYEWGANTRNVVKPSFRNLEYMWFEPEKLHAKGTTYYAGSYLRTMLSILFMIVALGIASIAAMCFQLLVDKDWMHAIPAVGTGCLVLWLSVVKVRQLSQRRRLLEGGILCIHSCAIMWHLVITAHGRALASLSKIQGGSISSFEGYTRELSTQSLRLCEHLRAAKSPHEWIHELTAVRKERSDT